MFLPEVRLTAGLGPVAIATGDFNNDGRPDLIAANQNSADVSVFLNAGGGTFQPALTTRAGLEPNTLALADLNGDGLLDAVVPNIYTPEITVLLGQGDGTFQQAPSVSTYGITDWPSPTQIGDVNNDGHLDLVFAIPTAVGTAGLGVALGNGDGTFQAAYNTQSNLQTAWLASGDFDRDGRIDVVVVGPAYFQYLWYFAGNGDGTFQPSPLPQAAVPPGVVQAADLNGDGLPDLLIGGITLTTTYGLAVRFGRGDGTFEPEVDTQTAGTGQVITGNGLAAADFDGDGQTEVAVAPSGQAIHLYRLSAGGTFTGPEIYAAGAQASALTAGDFNGDGLPDLAVANFHSGDLSLLLNAACPRPAP